MTETDWLWYGDYVLLIQHVRSRLSPRTQRLIACGWCRLRWELLTDERSRWAVEIGERFADGRATEDELHRAFTRAAEASEECMQGHPLHEHWEAAMWADSCANADESAWENAAEAAHPDDVGREAIADLIREVVGNPFRTPALTPWCVTPDVGRMARVIYDSRTWADLPILADAVEEAGCADAAVLKHLRTPVKHVRGCWALDLILGKA